MHRHFLRTAAPALAAAFMSAVPAASHADLAFNVGAVTDYRYRGISQTRLKPTVQGGVDYSMGGFYVGTWASGVKWIEDVGGNAKVEVDIYGGYKGEIAKDLSYDVGVLTYQYPRNHLSPSANTTEVYGALSYGAATVKYSRSVTNTFGNPDSKNSYYLEASTGIDLGENVTLTPHLGYQRIGGPANVQASYTDYALTIARDFSGVVLSAAIVGTSADQAFYVSPVNGRKLGRTTVVVGVKYNF